MTVRAVLQFIHALVVSAPAVDTARVKLSLCIGASAAKIVVACNTRVAFSHTATSNHCKKKG